MTLQEYRAILLDCTKQDTQIGILTTWTNTALKELQRRRSWWGMKNTLTLTIPSGNGSVDLPITFKEPQSGINPLRATDNNTNPPGFRNWFLYTKQEIFRLLEIRVGAPDNKAYIDYVDPVSTLNVMGQVAGVSTIFQLDCYTYLADLAGATDHNYLTDNYPMMILEQAKVYAYRHVGTPDAVEMAINCQQEADRQFMENSADDGFKAVRGRRIRMGGY